MRPQEPPPGVLRAQTEDYKQWSLVRTAENIRAGTLTPVDVLEACLRRIDKYEPHVRAWVHIDHDGARLQAERLTAELRERGYPRSPLHGIPIGVKDIIDVFDLPTACGSKRWANSYARKDAACVAKLRQAGAVILGKTVTTAYAFLDPPVTRNPWDYDRTPGGSSSGSAAAVAYGGCYAALATQTGGSITRPASFCGVCSIKPSWGRVSVDGVLPLAASLDHIGVMARGVRDLAAVYQAVAGYDDGGHFPRAMRDVFGFKPPHQDRVRIGRLRGPFEDLADLELRDSVDRFGQNLVPAGKTDVHAEIIDLAIPAGFAEVWTNHRRLMAVQAAHYHGKRFQRYPDDYPPKIAELIQEGLTEAGPDVVDAFIHREGLLKQLVPIFDELDALLTPAALGPAPGPETTGDAAFSAPWSYLGLPTVSFPIGQVGGHANLPVAVQLIGRPGGESELLAVAAWCEERHGWLMGWPPEAA